MRQRLLIAAIAAATGLFGSTVFYAQVNRVTQLAPSSWESCEEMHDNYVRRFESAPGFGLSRMAQPQMLDRSGILDLGRTRYSVESIELVGLLKLDKPAVYVPAWHGAKPAPDGFTSRQLTGFEKTSLASFGAGKGMASAVDDDSRALQCIGALRAKDSCLTCHRDKKAGDLLGAFTYRLVAIKGDQPR